MKELALPESEFKYRTENGRRYIFDKIRKKFVAATPEEIVRQRFIAYLTNHKGYPEGRIGHEISLNLNGCRKRCDTVVYDNYGNPCSIIEYKAPDINITQEVFNQIARYNIVLRVRFLIVSNGMNHYCCSIDYDSGKCRFIDHIPEYGEMLQQAGQQSAVP